MFVRIQGEVQVSVRGPVHPDDLPLYRAAAAAAVETDAARVVLDLAHAVVEPQSVAVLTLMRRYLESRARTLDLAALPATAADVNRLARAIPLPTRGHDGHRLGEGNRASGGPASRRGS